MNCTDELEPRRVRVHAKRPKPRQHASAAGEGPAAGPPLLQPVAGERVSSLASATTLAGAPASMGV